MQSFSNNLVVNLVVKRVIDDTTTSNSDRSILLTFLGLYQRKIDQQAAVKTLFKAFVLSLVLN